MSTETLSPQNAISTPMNPDRVAFNLKPELKDRLRIFMAKNNYSLREQSNAINDLLEFALTQKEY